MDQLKMMKILFFIRDFNWK